MIGDDLILPRTDLTVEHVRGRLSGLHFSQEALTQGERNILYMAEGLLRLVEQLLEKQKDLLSEIANSTSFID